MLGKGSALSHILLSHPDPLQEAGGSSEWLALEQEIPTTGIFISGKDWNVGQGR